MKALTRLKPLRGGLAVSLLMLAAVPGAPAKAQSDQWNALYDRIIRLEHEVRSGGGGAGGGSNARIEQQLGQLAAQVNAMQQQMIEMQRELNRLRELERQGLLFRNRRTASVISPQQQPQQWNQGQVAPNPNYGQMQQSVTIDGQGSGSTGQLPRGGLATGPQTLGTLVLRDDQAQPYQPSPPPVVPQVQQQVQQQQVQQPQYAAPQPVQPVQPQGLPRQTFQPRQVQGVQSNALPPPPRQAGRCRPSKASRNISCRRGPQAYQPQPAQEPAFDAEGRPIIAEGGSGASLAPEKVETALLDGSAGGSNLAAGGSVAGGAVDDAAGRMFLQAKSSYTSRDFTGAVSGFKTFILKNKDHELADDAQFFLGEAYYAQGQYKQAAQSYLSGYQNYPKGDKRGESLLKLAMSLDKLGQKKQACATFGEVNKKFAKEAAVRNASLKEMQRAGCN
jgi:tol-pal system protein YbgF